LGLAFAGPTDEAVTLTDDLVDDAEATRNPAALCLGLLAEGLVFRDAKPARALAALRRGLTIAQNNGIRMGESHLAAVLCRVEANYATLWRHSIISDWPSRTTTSRATSP
jgi:hypothetical protein